MTYKLTDKSKDLITVKEFDGDKYSLCDRFGDTELWIKLTPVITDKCSICGYIGAALQNHHVRGRKNSDETIRVCANCHVEIHKGAQ